MAVQPLYQRLAKHPLFLHVSNIGDLHCFMESHVYAVWDFMSLLKALQRGLTCIDVPWTPSAFPESRYLINQIVLGEESDLYEGHPLSHFEIYRLAMQSCGASTATVDSFLNLLQEGTSIDSSLSLSSTPSEAQEFVQATFRFIRGGQLHIQAAAFTFGREDLIPDMFRNFLRDLNRELHGKLEPFLWYLQRHIEVDEEEHGPMSLRMIADLCGEDKLFWEEAKQAATEALQARLALWDGIVQRIQRRGL